MTFLFDYQSKLLPMLLQNVSEVKQSAPALKRRLIVLELTRLNGLVTQIVREKLRIFLIILSFGECLMVVVPTSRLQTYLVVGVNPILPKSQFSSNITHATSVLLKLENKRNATVKQACAKC